MSDAELFLMISFVLWVASVEWRLKERGLIEQRPSDREEGKK